MTESKLRQVQKQKEGEKEKEKEKKIEKGGQRDNKGRLRAFAAVLEPRLISPITPYSATTHDPPTSRHLLQRCRPPLASGPTSRSWLPPIRHPSATHLLGATMERLTRSNPRHSRLFSRARALLPFLNALASLHRLYTTSVDEVCLTRGSVYRIYYRPCRPPFHPLDGLGRLSSSY